MEYGILYGVGVGPGDPELMTLKAVRIIESHTVIAVPGTDAKAALAYRIAAQSVPSLAEKTLLALPMPMTRDAARMAAAHRTAAAQIAEYLRRGEDVVYLTLGSPSLYSSFGYLQPLLAEMGFRTETVCGVSAVSAAAAALSVPLTSGSEELHIIPALTAEAAQYAGTVAVMKSGGTLAEISGILQGKTLYAAENCGMESERLFRGNLPASAGYFTVIIAKPQGGI